MTKRRTREATGSPRGLRKTKPAHSTPRLRKGSLVPPSQEGMRGSKQRAVLHEEKQYRALFENMLNGFAYCKMIFEGGVPKDFIYLDVNKAFESQTGIRDVIGRKVSEVIPGIRKSDPNLFEIYGRVANSGTPESFETYVEALKMWFSISVYSPHKGYFVAVFDVITKRKLAQEKINRQNRTYAVLSNINHLIVRERDKGRLLEQSCQIAVNDGKFRMVWIGEVNESTGRVEPVATAGVLDDYLASLNNTLRDGKEGRGPTGTVLREGHSVIVNDIEHDRTMGPLSERALSLGYRSSASIPLRRGLRIWGTVNFYSSEVGFFDAEEIQLLDELAIDIAFALDSLEAEVARKEARAALEESEVRFTAAFQNSPISMTISSARTGKYIEVNDAFTKKTGFTREDVIGHTSEELKVFYDPADRDRLFSQLRKDGFVHGVEIPFRIKSGEVLDCLLSSQLTNLQGEPHLLSTITDITKRKRTEEELIRAEALLRTALENLPLIFYVIDPDGTFNRSIGAGLKALGLQPNQVVGQSAFDVYKDFPNITESVKKALNGERVEFESNVAGSSFDNFLVPFFNAKNEFAGIVGVALDITDRKRSQEALQTKERYQRALLDNFPFAAWLKDTESRFLAVNEAFAKTFNIPTADELVGKTDFDITTPDVAELYRASDREVLESRRKKVVEEAVAGLGEHTWFETYKAPVVGKYDEPLGTVGYLRNISERRRAEEQLRENAEFFRLLFTTSPDAILLFDPNSTRVPWEIVDCNEVACSMNGYTRDELVGKSVDLLTTNSMTREEREAYRNRLLDKGVECYETTHRHRDGHIFPIEVATSLITRGGRQLILGIDRDITQRKRTEERIGLLAHTVRSIRECVSITDMNDTILFVNDAFLTTYGYAEHEILGKNTDIIGSPNNPRALLGEVREAARKAGWHGELLNRTNAGREFPVELSTSIVQDEHGKAVALVGVASDITERRIAEQTQLLLSTALESTANGVVITDVDGSIAWVNNAFEKMTGYRGAEIKGQNLRILKSGKQDSAFYRALWETIAAGNVWTGELINKKKDGVLYTDETTITPLRNTKGEVTNFIAIKQDITERKRAEEQLRLSDEIIKKTNALILSANANGEVTYASPSVKTILGYDPAEVLGDGWWLSTREDNRERDQARMETARAASGEIPLAEAAYETKLKSKDGETHWILWQDARGAHEELIGVGQDISERKRAEEALLYEQSLLRAIMDNMPDNIYFKDKESRFLRISRSQANHFNLGDPTEAVGKTDFDFFSGEHARPAFEDEQKIIESGIALVGVEEKESWPDGHETWVSTTKVPLQDAHGQIIGTFGISRDITGLKRSEQALRESEEKYRSLFERNLAATFVSTPSGKLIDCNPAYVQMFGFESYEQAKSTNMSRLYADLKERERLLNTVQSNQKAENIQLKMVKLDSTPMYVIANAVGKFDEQGKLIQKTGYLIDDTKRHRLERELIQSQKLESLGILAGGIAHDFNNILGILMGHVSLLVRVQDDPELHKTSLDAIDTALKRGSGLVRQLLTFARKTDSQFDSVFINDTVKELLKLLRETLPKSIESVAEFGSQIPAIFADAGQLHQVLLNLCVNARDAMPAGGKLRIRTTVVEAREILQRFSQAASEKYVAIEVQDTGTGMDEATKTRIFEPFFTTKETGKGTGLGLAVAFGVIQTHKGFIDVQSELGKGTTFRVYLPIEAHQPEKKSVVKVKFEDSPSGTETILFVEDEPLLYETSQIALVSKGYKVLYAKNGLEAIEMYRNHYSEIQLVLTDMDLPKLGGEQLVRELLEINPKLKIIFASGYVEPEVKAKVLASGAKAFLPKPYEPATLLAKVREILDSQT